MPPIVGVSRLPVHLCQQHQFTATNYMYQRHPLTCTLNSIQRVDNWTGQLVGGSGWCGNKSDWIEEKMTFDLIQLRRHEIIESKVIQQVYSTVSSASGSHDVLMCHCGRFLILWHAKKVSLVLLPETQSSEEREAFYLKSLSLTRCGWLENTEAAFERQIR